MQSHPIGAAQAEQDLARATDRHRKSPLCLLTEPRGLGAYRGYGEVLAQIAELARRGAAVSVIGRSVRDEPIFALSVGPNSARRTTAMPSESSASCCITKV